MERSTKLGIASVFLIVGCALPSPFNLMTAVISCVLGLMAAQQGNKLWLIVPGTVLIMASVMVYVGFHAS